MRAKSRAFTKAKAVTVSVTNVPNDLLSALRADAKNNHRSLSGHVRALLADVLTKRKGAA
jgi:plasmid stability protein